MTGNRRRSRPATDQALYSGDRLIRQRRIGYWRPEAAIATGSVHYILKPAEMASTLQALLKRLDVVGCVAEWENPFQENRDATGT